LGEGGRRQTKR